MISSIQHTVANGQTWELLLDYWMARVSWVSNWCLISMCTPAHTHTHSGREEVRGDDTELKRQRNKESNKSDGGRAEDKEKEAGRINAVYSHRGAET